jgi:hypothetical protein
MEKALDNPAWSALTTTQTAFAPGTAAAKRYKTGILPFVGLETPDAQLLAPADLGFRHRRDIVFQRVRKRE